MSQSDSDEVVMVGTKRLSRAAYEHNLEVSRRWKAEHREEAEKHWWRECACGNRMRHNSQMCSSCWARENRVSRDARCRQIERWWAEGLSLLNIAERLGWTRNTLGSEINWMRANGYDVPYRHRGYGANR